MNKFLPNLRDQKGALHLLLLFSALAVVVFLGLSSLAPFRDQLLSVINRKQDSFASLPSDTSYTTKVLVLKYFPVDSSGQNLDAAVTGSNKQLSSVREYVDKTTNEGVAQLTNGTKFHGYKDSAAQPAITYQIINTKEYLEALPVSNIHPPNNLVTYRPDYQKVLSRENICDYVDNQGVSQIWLWGYHYGLIEPAESDMSMGTRSQQFWNHGTYGDVSNGEQSDNMPVCNKTYVLYNYNFQSGLGEFLEDHGHQIEALYRFIDGNLWNDFQKPNGDTNPSIVNHCGWTHSPPNAGDWSGPRGQYQWSDKTLVKSNCEDWQPGGGGTVKDVNCNAWYEPYYKVSYANIACQDDTGVAFKVWWMQNIPGRGNTLTYQGKPLRNWWDLYADFDAAIAYNKSLLIDTSPNVKVSSTISANGWDKGNAVDGKYDSAPASMGWTSNSKLSSNHTEWIQLDLGSVKEINQVKLYPRTDKPGFYFPVDFQIQLSIDGTDFTNVVDKQNYPKPLAQVQVFPFATTQARYVKINATYLRNDEGDFRVQLAEIEALNIPTVSPSPSPSPSSFVRVISPNGGETFKVGDKVNITWSGVGRTSYSLGWTTGTTLSTITSIDNGQTNSYLWTVNVGNMLPGTSKQVKIKLDSYPSGLGTSDQSDNFFTVVSPALEVTKTFQISSSGDDMNQYNSSIDPNYGLNSQQLWIGKSDTDQSYTGLRFSNVSIPQGAKIKSAKLEVNTYSNQDITLSLDITGDKSTNSPAFASSSPPSSRPKTSASLMHTSRTLWPANTWNEIRGYSGGDYSKTVDMSSIIQEIVNQQSWQSGNSLSLVLKGWGNNWTRKFISSYDRNPQNAPKLTITYE